MKDHLTSTVRANVKQGLRELFRRAKEDDDYKATGALYCIESWLGVLIRDMEDRKEAGK